MTGAQYGWPLPATMPWGTFIKERVEILKEIRKFGQTAQDLQVERAATDNQELRYHYKSMDEMKQRFNMHLKQWQKNVSLLKDMLKLPEEDFQCKQASLLQFMDEKMAALRLEFNEAMAAATAAEIAKSQASKFVTNFLIRTERLRVLLTSLSANLVAKAKEAASLLALL